VIGDSTFMHMGMQGLLDITYNGGNVTVLLLDNRAVGMTGGQAEPGLGQGHPRRRSAAVDCSSLVEALGVKKERIHVVDPYQLPVLFKTVRDEIKIEGSLGHHHRPPLRADRRLQALPPYSSIEDKCTGCGNCVEVGCPAIHVTAATRWSSPRARKSNWPSSASTPQACTGCGLCVQPCAPDAIVHAAHDSPSGFVRPLRLMSTNDVSPTSSSAASAARAS
jgi:indolepyruvate ferredoxin oxidoreductase alpha subunit